MRRRQSATQTNGQGQPMLAHAIVNVPVSELGAFALPVLMLGMAIVYCRQIGEEFRKLGALLKYEIPSRTATVLGVVFMVAFAILVGISQDIALILGIVKMVVAVILEAVEKRQKRQVLQLASAA
jgi:hypothetical protein